MLPCSGGVDPAMPNLAITFIGLEHAHGLVVRVRNGAVEIDASALPVYGGQQAHFDTSDEPSVEKTPITTTDRSSSANR